MNNLRNYCEKSALIITSSGGGGHIAASNSLKSSLEDRKYKNIKVIDTMRSGCSYGEYLGKYSTDLWDNAQKLGDTRTQERLVGSQGVAEAFFFLGAFFTIYCTLMTSNKLPKRVVCTQPLHLKAITSAVRLANWQRGSADRKITRIDLYLTDLPRAKAVHFLKALERLKTYSFEKIF